jgi:hypothetical protein
MNVGDPVVQRRNADRVPVAARSERGRRGEHLHDPSRRDRPQATHRAPHVAGGWRAGDVPPVLVAGRSADRVQPRPRRVNAPGRHFRDER